jgi:hypothetical protein
MFAGCGSNRSTDSQCQPGKRNRHPWRECSDAHNGAVESAQTRKQVLGGHSELIEVSRSRFHVETAPVNLPYSGSKGVDKTCTDETTSIGMLIAVAPVAGSVTSALLLAIHSARIWRLSY